MIDDTFNSSNSQRSKTINISGTDAGNDSGEENGGAEHYEMRQLIDQIETIVEQIREVDLEYSIQNQGAINQEGTFNPSQDHQGTNTFQVRIDFRDTKIAQLVQISERLSFELSEANAKFGEKKSLLANTMHQL